MIYNMCHVLIYVFRNFTIKTINKFCVTKWYTPLHKLLKQTKIYFCGIKYNRFSSKISVIKNKSPNFLDVSEKKKKNILQLWMPFKILGLNPFHHNRKVFINSDCLPACPRSHVLNIHILTSIFSKLMGLTVKRLLLKI